MQEPAIHRGTDEHPGNGFGCGARITQRFGAQRVEVLLVKHAIATRDDHTRDLLIGPGAHRGGDVIQGGAGRAHELSATAEPCSDTGEQQLSRDHENKVRVPMRVDLNVVFASGCRRYAHVQAGAMRPKLGNAVEFPGPEESAHCWNLVRRCAADHAPPPRPCRLRSRIRTNRTVFRQGGENCVTYERVALAPHAVSRQIAR